MPGILTSAFSRPSSSCEAETPAGTGQRPARGVGEVKGTAQPLGSLAKGKQVSRYWDAYRQVLVTNLRSFAFVSEDTQGQAVEVGPS